MKESAQQPVAVQKSLFSITQGWVEASTLIMHCTRLIYQSNRLAYGSYWHSFISTIIKIYQEWLVQNLIPNGIKHTLQVQIYTCDIFHLNISENLLSMISCVSLQHLKEIVGPSMRNSTHFTARYRVWTLTPWVSGHEFLSQLLLAMAMQVVQLHSHQPLSYRFTCLDATTVGRYRSTH